ncbi:HD domain-containing protein [Jiangella anatolica]|uniref:5'-deoxynucleotidase n=1 Tax=Jiangella anatolica TaxID=2670374 RepID=A0A2W2BD91_9ACTN|nr:HD domain-containing protein [Jiangella anatolica]PZF83942.1 HAD family hydrolase [Jiangella anatolica]
MPDERQIVGVVDYIFEAGLLKRAKRTGWWIAGVKDPESIAEHSHRTAVIGSVLALMEGADPARVALLAVLHDTQETRVGDIPYLGRRYLDAASNQEVTADQVAEAPDTVRDGIQRIVDDYEGGDSIEVVVAHDADKLDCLFQALEYREQGNQNMQQFIDSMLVSLKTPSAQQIAAAALSRTSQEWHVPHLGRRDRES